MAISNKLTRVAVMASVLSVTLGAAQAFAASTDRTLDGVGVTANGTVVIDVSGAALAGSCAKGDIVYVRSDAAGREGLLSTALAAQLAGRTVTLEYTRDANLNCYVDSIKMW